MIKRLKTHSPNKNPDFIGSWIIEPTEICDQIIDYFEFNKDKQQKGQTAMGYNLDSKDRMDITIRPKDIIGNGNDIFKNYFESLFECYEDYTEQFLFLKSILLGQKLEIGWFNIGKYGIGQHYQKLHCERSTIENIHRVFAFMTYLNDVEEGGGTFFSHYDLEIKPKKALTLIWPVEWTHAHKGNVVKSGDKYIVTGHMTFSN